MRKGSEFHSQRHILKKFSVPSGVNKDSFNKIGANGSLKNFNFFELLQKECAGNFFLEMIMI